MPLEDEILLAEEQPLPAADSPTTDSPRYIPESGPEEDPIDYPTDGGDDDDDDGLSDDYEDDDNDNALPSPDYVPGPKEPKQAPPLLEFVPEPVYPEFMPLEDEILLAEEQPIPAADSSTTDSQRYIPESGPKEDPIDYPTDGGDDDDDDGLSDDYEDDDNDNVQEEEDEDEEEEHPAMADSIPPQPVHRTTTRISIPIPSPQLLVSPPLPVSFPLLPASPTYPLRYRADMIQLRAETPSTSHLPPLIVLPHTRASMAMLRAATPSTYILAPRSEIPPSGTPPLLPIPLHTSSPPLILPSTSHKADVPEVTLPHRKRLCIAL
nr:hypothetical protein [Tanacetum cinerariifolium]